VARITVDGQPYELDVNNLLNVELIAITKATGMELPQLGQALKDGSVLALTALVWVLRRRSEPGLRFDDVQFTIGSLQLEDDAAGPKESAPESVTGTPTDPSSVSSSDSSPGTSTG
jgi:hypothetical protein